MLIGKKFVLSEYSLSGYQKVSAFLFCLNCIYSRVFPNSFLIVQKVLVEETVPVVVLPHLVPV